MNISLLWAMLRPSDIYSYVVLIYMFNSNAPIVIRDETFFVKSTLTSQKYNYFSTGPSWSNQDVNKVND